VTARSKALVCGLFLAGVAGSNLAGAWLSGCCVLSGRGFCEGRSLVLRSPTACGVSECVLETSTTTRATRAAEPWEWGRGWKSVFRYVPATYVQCSPGPKSHFGRRPRKSTGKNKFIGEVCFTDSLLN
jgi:hypothetical protein